MIEPKVLKGFRDSLPQQELVRQNLISKVQSIFRSFGFVPIDTPALEYTEVLLGKGGGETDKQMFRFQDNGGRDVALRFDLTVPLARFVAANTNNLSFPFKRYHISKVWRGEKPQKGRYREFLQCDFDIIGADNEQADFEILLLIHTCLKEMGVGPFKVKVSHRELLNNYLAINKIENRNTDVLRAIDKLDKIGIDGVKEILCENGLSNSEIDKILTFINLPKDNFEKTLKILTDIFGYENASLIRLTKLFSMMKECGIQEDFALDMSITRGLDYYTGIVYETTLLQMPEIGSICSGGRYNNLAGLYTKDNLPGVGSCIGLDRLIAALEELKSPIVTNTGFAQLMVVSSESDLGWSQKTAIKFRKLGIKTECYTGNKVQGQQFAYAQAQNIPYVIFSETNGLYNVKEISTRKVFENLNEKEVTELLNK